MELLLLLLLLLLMNDVGIDKKQQHYIIKKMINIAIRATYYIFCCRNRNWDSPDLMQFWFFFGFCFVFVFVFCFVLFCFFFLFNNPISSSISKLPIRSEIYNCTLKNTNKVSITIIIIIIISIALKIACKENSLFPFMILACLYLRAWEREVFLFSLQIP